MNRNTIVLALLVVYSGLMFAQTAAEQVDLLFSYEKYEAAKKTALGWIESDPKNADAYYVAGKLFSKIALDDTSKPELIDSAAMFFNKGIEANKKFPYNYIGKLRIAYHHKEVIDKEKREEYFEQAKDYTSARKDQRLHLEMADACLLAPFEDNPINEYIDAAKKIDRKNPVIYSILGQFYLLQNDATKANQNFQTVIDYNPKAVRAYFERGEVYFRANNNQAAEEQYLKAIEMDADFAPAYVRLAEMFYGEKKFAKAAENFEKYIQYAEPSLLNQRRFASFLYRNKDYKRVVTVVNDVLASQPSEPTLLRLLAWSCFELNDSLNAATAFERYFAVARPEMILYDDCARYALALTKTGQDDMAIEYYKKAYAMDTAKKDPLTSMATIFSKQKNWKGVIEVLVPKVAGGKDISFGDYFQLGLAYYFDSSFQKSKETFTKCLEISPNSFSAYHWLATAMGQTDTVITEGALKPVYEKILQLAADRKVVPDSVKAVKDVIQAYRYLGSYYIAVSDLPKAKEMWLNILAIDANDAQAKEVLNSKEFKPAKEQKKPRK